MRSRMRLPAALLWYPAAMILPSGARANDVKTVSPPGGDFRRTTPLRPKPASTRPFLVTRPTRSKPATTNLPSAWRTVPTISASLKAPPLSANVT